MAKRKKKQQRLPEATQAELDDILVAALDQIRLPEKETGAIITDLRALYMYYYAQGIPFGEASVRIGDLLGDFYVPANPAEWYPLDSAAKVYPLSLTHKSMSIFRISATLAEPVIPCVLQAALLSTVRRFPLFATTIRRGLFWHYLDATRRRFVIEEERTMPCQPMKVSGHDALSFRVQYYGRRVSLEVFHILTDGTGAMTFLKTLLREYLRLLGREIPYAADIFDPAEPPDSRESADMFPRGDPADKAEGFAQLPAAQIGGRRTFYQPAGVVDFVMPSSALRAAAKARGTTVTGLLLAIIFAASAASLNRPKPRARLHVQVPVNMRKFYPTRTLRNFSMYSVLRLYVEEAQDIDTALPLIDGQLREGTAKPALDRMLRMTNELVENPILRNTPLFLKRAVFQRVYKLIGERTLTTTLSNLGVVDGAFGNVVERFDFMLGPSGTNNVNCGLISYGEAAVLTLTKSTRDDRFERRVCELLSDEGISMTIEEVSA